MLTGVRRARGWSRSHPLLADAVLAAALLGAAAASARVTIGIFDEDPTFERPDAAGVGVLLAAMTLPLGLRRRFPLAVLAVSTAAFVALGLQLGPRLEATFTAIVLALAFYSAAAHGRARRRDSVCGLCVVAVVALTVHEFHALGGDLPVLYYVFTAVGSAALLVALWALG